MTKKETAVILGLLKTAYPRFYANLKKDDAEKTLALWTEMLADYELNVVSVAVKRLLSEMVFPPTIADVRKALVNTTTEKKMDTAEAWGQVVKAISLYGWRQEERALNSLDETTRAVAKSMGFKDLCLSENQMADRAHFIKMYESYADRKQKEQQIPLSVKKQSELIQNNLKQIGTI